MYSNVEFAFVFLNVIKTESSKLAIALRHTSERRQEKTAMREKPALAYAAVVETAHALGVDGTQPADKITSIVKRHRLELVH